MCININTLMCDCLFNSLLIALSRFSLSLRVFSAADSDVLLLPPDNAVHRVGYLTPPTTTTTSIKTNRKFFLDGPQKKNLKTKRNETNACCRMNRADTSVGTPSYKTHMKLTIFSVSMADYGMYKCVAKNPRGETDGTIRLYGKFKTKIYLYIFINMM